jgi:hypothetical protein
MCRLGWVLALAIATSSWSSVQAQTPAEPDQERPLVPPELTVAPLAPKFGQEPLPPQAGKPANICQELVAFIELRANTIPDRPRPPSPSGPPAIDKPQHSSGLLAPVPSGETVRKPPLITFDQARLLAAANDVRACQEATKRMRRAGVALPDTLIALGALRPDLLEAAASP